MMMQFLMLNVLLKIIVSGEQWIMLSHKFSGSCSEHVERISDLCRKREKIIKCIEVNTTVWSFVDMVERFEKWTSERIILDVLGETRIILIIRIIRIGGRM